MKKSVLLLFSLLYLTRIMAQDGYTITGCIYGSGDGDKVYLYNLDEQAFIDSAVVKGEHFLMKGSVAIPVTCWIRYKDEYATIMVENTQLHFNSPAKQMRLKNVCNGGPEQDLFTALTKLQLPYDKIYFAAYDSLTAKQYRDAAHRKQLAKDLNDYQDSSQAVYIAFGLQHPSSYLGMDIIYRNRQTIGKDTTTIAYYQMDADMKATVKGKALATFIYGDLAEKGKALIDFETSTLDNKSFKLSSLKGNYILLSFWNAACGPCRKENRRISEQWSTLQKRFTMVSFSTDKNKAQWSKASKEDNIKWINVSDLQGDNGKIKTQYDVQALPTAYLINKEGIIIEKFIGLEDDFIDRIIKLLK